MPAAPHPLLAYFLDAADGCFPPADGAVTVLPALPTPPGALEASVAFTGHAVLATALAAPKIHALRPDGFGGSMGPDFLRALAGPTGWIGSVDAVLVRRGFGGAARLQPLSGADGHPRVRYARRLRAGVRVFGDERGLVTLAAGLAGRTELSIELHTPDHGGRSGHGRSLLGDALTLVQAGEPVFAAVAPGNARSMRAFLAAGFTPVGAEVIVRPDRAPAQRRRGGHESPPP
ncbi:hypothetical protein C6376_26530 [Streptomyces sp. P3]|nr:hypothetical protein C6376_26530 [Streptomyces sp. P3]